MPKSLEPISLEIFQQAVSKAESIADVARALNWTGGSAYGRIKKLGEKYQIDVPVSVNNAHLIGRRIASRLPDSQVFTENSTYTSLGGLKDRLREQRDVFECDRCGLGEEWDGEYLCLQIDHVNGIRSDNRLENLRILCPNCHSQTDTYAGKKSRLKYPSDEELMRMCEEHGVTKTADMVGMSYSSLSHRKTKIIREKPELDYRK